MKKVTYFLIFVFLVSLAYAQDSAPELPNIQIYGDIIPGAADGTDITFEKEGIEIGAGFIYDNKYGYEPLIFLDAETGDTVEIFIAGVKVDEITFDREGVIKHDITISSSRGEEIEEQITVRRRRGGGGYVAPKNYTADYSELPQKFYLRRGDEVLLTFNGVQHTIRAQRLTYDFVKLTIASTPSELMLNVSQEGEVDLNDDNVNDIAVKYEGVEGNTGVISIRGVVIKVPPAPVEPIAPAPVEAPAVPEERGYGWVYVMIAIIVLALGGGVGFVFYEREKAHSALHEERKQKTLGDESFVRLQSYVRQTLQLGYTKEQIRNRLLEEGWSQNIVEQVLRQTSAM